MRWHGMGWEEVGFGVMEWAGVSCGGMGWDWM